MQSSDSKYHNQAHLIAGIRAVAPVFGTAIVFSFFINLLLFTSPLYMLQIYDRVITSRNEKNATCAYADCCLLHCGVCMSVIR